MTADPDGEHDADGMVNASFETQLTAHTPVADETPAAAHTPVADEPSTPLDAKAVTRRVLPCSIFMTVALIGSIVSPTLVNDHPAALLALSSRNRHLLFTAATDISPWVWFPLAFVRLVLPLPFFYLLGRDYGHRGVLWIERETQGKTGYLGWVQRWFAKLSSVLLVVMPNIYVLLFAGMDRMRPRRIIPLITVGLIGRLALFWWAGKHWKDELTDVLNFIQRYQWKLLAAFLVVAMVQGWVRSRNQPTVM
jgi:hypothetical protein